MSIRSVLPLVAMAAAGVVTIASPARATYFSFASDVNSQNPTFIGQSGPSSFTIHNPTLNQSNFNLLVDDNNGPQPTLSIPVQIATTLTGVPFSTVPVGPLVQHSYSISGEISIFDSVSGDHLLDIVINAQAPALMSVQGDLTHWFSAGAIFGSDSYSGISYFLFNAGVNRLQAALPGGASLADYGVFGAGASSGPDDLAFTMTVINNDGTQVNLDPQTHLPQSGWTSEGSFSGSATFVPAPGSTALVALGAMFMLRRRR